MRRYSKCGQWRILLTLFLSASAPSSCIVIVRAFGGRSPNRRPTAAAATPRDLKLAVLTRRLLLQSKRPLGEGVLLFLSADVHFHHGPYPPLVHKDAKKNNSFDECWASSSKGVNPDKRHDIDKILQGLVSPAPQSFYVLQRAMGTRHQIGQPLTVEEVASACEYLLKDQYRLIIRNNNDGESSVAGRDWSLAAVNEAISDDWKMVHPTVKSQSVHQLASEILDVVQEASDAQVPVDEEEIGTKLDQLKRHLDLTLGTDIRGRTAADTAFTLALAGITDQSVFQDLYQVVQLELERTSHRVTCRSKDLLHIVEKVAASGAERHQVARIYNIVAEALTQRGEHIETASTLAASVSDPAKPFGFLTPRPLLWLWRFSSRLRKPMSGHVDWEDVLPSNRSLESWKPTFKDNNRPLVIDVGCGFGASLLGLASQASSDGRLLGHDTSWTDCNYLGCDLCQLTLRFASSISQRWSSLSTDRLDFVWMSTETMLDQISKQYPGRVALILLQFPTPFRLLDTEVQNGESRGNTQLPHNETEGFMASQSIIKQIAQLMLRKGNGRLVVQSNCEDVALAIRDLAVVEGCHAIAVDEPVQSPSKNEAERTTRWLALNSDAARAVGKEWSSISLLPLRCATETYVSCQLLGIPIHRCVLEIKGLDK
jgi:SAM-dependent methyltransferase